jgi:NAD-dependent SIR2 family protein deacetylase
MTKDEFELRGKLATLKCWHRLTQEEEEDLLRFAAAQPEQEQNFCPRCGKRTADLTTIHTCTPPQDKNT